VARRRPDTRRRDPHPRAVHRDLANAGLSGRRLAIGHALFHPFALRSARRGLLGFDAAAAAAHGSWPDRWAVADEAQRASLQRFHTHPPTLLDKVTDPYTILTPFSIYTLSAAARQVAARRLILATLAIERFRRAHAGTLPASGGLPEDPFSSAPLVLKTEPAGYVIYSLGVNRKDDAGALYGVGAGGPRNYSLQTRDYGIRVATVIK